MAAQNSTRKWLFIGGGVIAAAVVVVFFQNYPPQPKDAAGTIGGAQRYHDTQITGDDVKVSQDALTAWVQSDTFDRIVKDPQARKLFTDAAVMGMFNDAARKQNVDGGRKLNVDDTKDLGRKLNVDDTKDLGRKLNVDDTKDLGRKLNVDDTKDLARSLKTGDAAIRAQAMENAAIRDALRNQAFCQALMNDGVRAFLVSEARKADAGGKTD
jgi:hypothetical protein